MLKFIIFGKKEEYLSLLSYTGKQPDPQSRQTDIYDTFLSYLSEDAPQAIFILMDGAIGMEGVIAAKNLCPSCPVVWISNDKGFGIQSYRLGCVFFSDKPLTAKKVKIAFMRIEQTMFEENDLTRENRFAHLDEQKLLCISHATTSEELITNAQKYGITIKKEEADNYFRYLSDIQCGELDDDLLDQIVGGIDTSHFKLFFDSAQDLDM